MSNPAILRPQVHRLAEACSSEGEAFQTTATRLIKQQRRLSRFFEQNFAPMGPMAGQVSMYMLSVSIRIFDQAGGRLKKVPGRDIDAAAAKIMATAESIMPADDDFAARAQAVEWRAQPHLLDEILWALFERNEKQEAEVDLDPNTSAMVYLMLWAAVEALDQSWIPAKDWTPESGLSEGEDPATWTPPEA
jgi:hypothetical protein